MRMQVKNGEIILDKHLNKLDKFVLGITKLFTCKYVIVSGYVEILFGRNRASEDIDFLIPRLKEEEFKIFWDSVIQEFECLNTPRMEEALKEYLSEKHAIRFSPPKAYLPNAEIKFVQNELDSLALDSAIKVVLNGTELYVSPIEMQIAYKLYLGSDKDVEDAVFLFELFRKTLDMETLHEFGRKLQILEKINTYLK